MLSTHMKWVIYNCSFRGSYALFWALPALHSYAHNTPFTYPEVKERKTKF